MTIVFFCTKKIAPFSTFAKKSRKQQVLRISEIVYYFKVFLQITIEILWFYKNVLGDRGLQQNLVFLFQVENGLHGKK